MRYTEQHLLLLPPKCGSRFCEDYVLGGQLTEDDLDLSETLAHIKDPARRRVIASDWRRHAPLRHIPDSIKNGKTTVVMTRDPKSWYESWWKHMSQQDFAWNAYWGHTGRIQQRSDGHLVVPANVPPFKTALRDYIFGWQDRANIQMAQRVNRAGAIVWGVGTNGYNGSHLAMQAQEGVGWWSHWMHYMASKEQGVWNVDARFVMADGDIEKALTGVGFTLVDGEKKRRGQSGLRSVNWDDEMLTWLAVADGPTLNLVNGQSL